MGDTRASRNIEALIHRLRLEEEDRVVLLGDLIDRGPDSTGVVEYVREHPQWYNQR